MTEERGVQPYQEPDSRLTLGQTQLDSSDLVMPRVKVVQAMSQEAQDGKAKQGEFWNTLTGENYGESLRFIPLLPFKHRIFILRDERRKDVETFASSKGLVITFSEGTGLKCRSLDFYQGIGEPGMECNACPLKDWMDGGIPPYCSETYNLAAMTELGDLIILSFSKSAAKVGKQAFSMLRLARGGGAAPWVNIYEAETSKRSNERGTFAVPAVRKVGETPPELLKVALQWAGQLAGTVIDVSPIDEDAGGEGGAPATEPPF